MRASYTRLFPDQDGTSHFEDVEMELLPGFAAPPAEPLHFADFVRLGQSRYKASSKSLPEMAPSVGSSPVM